MAKREPKAAVKQGLVEYSEKVEGDRNNYGWSVQFDRMVEGCLGITQYDEKGKLQERVLLTPFQVDEMLRFINRQKRKWAGK